MTKEELLRELLSVLNDIEFYSNAEVIKGEYDEEIKSLNKKRNELEKQLTKTIIEEI